MELTDEEAARWERYRALGSPDDLETALRERDGLTRADLIRRAAAATGYREPVLARLSEGLTLSVEDNRARIVTEDGPVPLREYAEREWADFLPSLKAEAESPRTPYVRQGGSDAPPPPPTVALDYVRRTYGPRTAD